MNNEYVDHNNTDPVRALIAEWRESAADTQRYSASDYADGYAAAKSYCANRLEAALASAPVGVEDLPGDLRWKLEKLRPGSSGVVTLNRAEWDYVRAALSQQSVGEVCIRLNGIGEGGPYPVVNGVCVLPQSFAENLVASTVGQQMKRELLAQWASYKQPAAPSGAAASAEPAVWVAADTLNSPHPACISSLAYMSQLDRERGREYVPLYAAPQQPVGVDGLLADLETIWHSVSDDKETNAAYERLKIALAQQPASVGEEIMVNAAHGVFTLPLQPSGLSGGPRFVVHVPAPEQRAREMRDLGLHEDAYHVGCGACGDGCANRSGGCRLAAENPPAAPSAPVGVEDDPIDASDNAEYIEHCADRLERCGLRVTAGALRVIAHEHRALALAEQQHTALQAENERLLAEVSGLRAARIAYANEFPATEDGDPDTGNIHANIRALKVHAERLRAEVDKWQALCEALTAALSSAEKSIERTRSLESAMADLIEAATELRARQRDYLSQPKGERVEQKGRLVGEAAARLDAALARVQGGRADG